MLAPCKGQLMGLNAESSSAVNGVGHMEELLCAQYFRLNQIPFKHFMFKGKFCNTVLK
jgi:hypothetical protein